MLITIRDNNQLTTLKIQFILSRNSNKEVKHAFILVLWKNDACENCNDFCIVFSTIHFPVVIILKYLKNKYIQFGVKNIQFTLVACIIVEIKEMLLL